MVIASTTSQKCGFACLLAIAALTREWREDSAWIWPDSCFLMQTKFRSEGATASFNIPLVLVSYNMQWLPVGGQETQYGLSILSSLLDFPLSKVYLKSRKRQEYDRHKNQIKCNKMILWFLRELHIRIYGWKSKLYNKTLDGVHFGRCRLGFFCTKKRILKNMSPS